MGVISEPRFDFGMELLISDEFRDTTQRTSSCCIIHVELATDLPARIEIDVTDLGLGESIHVSDLLEEEARILTDSSITILNVLMPRLITEDEVEGEEGEGEGDEVEGEGEGEEGEGDEAES